jgi:hypothetical protein
MPAATCPWRSFTVTPAPAAQRADGISRNLASHDSSDAGGAHSSEACVSWVPRLSRELLFGREHGPDAARRWLD